MHVDKITLLQTYATIIGIESYMYIMLLILDI